MVLESSSKSKPKVIYAHGFEGRPDGAKAQYLGNELGFQVVAPTMYGLGWSFHDQVQVVLKALDEHPNAHRVVGSSMGGFAVAVALSQRTSRQAKCVLMAPAIGIHASWARALGDSAMESWANSGFLAHAHASAGREVQLPYELWTQCRDAAKVVIGHPCVIIHGRADDIVPFSNSEALAARSPGVITLLATDDEHRLSHSLGSLKTALNYLE